MMNFKLVILFGVIVACASGASLDEVSIGNNALTAALYKELIKTNEGNVLISPFSVEVILALTENGAKEETAKEIRTSLNLPDNDEEIQRMFKRVLPILKSDANFTLNTANKIYVKDSLTLQEQFQKVAREVYQAEAECIDFTQNVEAAEAINQWVEEQTENKIHDLINSDSLDPLTDVILVNALHFKGQWRHGFDSRMTKKRSFYRSTRDAMEVDMMYNTVLYREYSADAELDAQFLEMPFWGENISMVIVLPNENEGITTLESQIEKVFVPRKFQRKLFEVEIPKFKIERTIGLTDILQNLGVKKVFSETEADLSGIVNESEDLYVSDVKQKTFIAVDEKGVEAAAASFEEVATTSVSQLKFVADRPFIFYIKFDDLILFAGRVTVPEQ